MFIILNRLRGTWSWMAKVIGTLIGAVFYYFTADIYTSIALAAMYVLGESMGWGKWIGGIYRKNTIPSEYELKDIEGEDNGIHYLANKIYDESTNYYKYCITALSIRGFYWAGLALLPLTVAGYVSVPLYLLSSLILAAMFPLSVEAGIKSTERFNFKGMNGFWEHAETWFGFTQDIALVILLLSITQVF